VSEAQPNTHTTATATVNIFIFMPPLSHGMSFERKLFTRFSLGKILAEGHTPPPLHELWLGSLTAAPASLDV
jgi:hypothetical protein